MKLNKTYTILLIWVMHFYIFYGLTTLYQHYQSETLHTTFWDIKSSLEFILFVPIVSIMLGIYYPIFVSIILMIILVEYKKIKIYKSFLISLLFFFIAYLILFLQYNNYLQYDFEWVVCLISLIISAILVKFIFGKTMNRLNKQYNLK